jgi:hypothetical protein
LIDLPVASNRSSVGSVMVTGLIVGVGVGVIVIVGAGVGVGVGVEVSAGVGVSVEVIVGKGGGLAEEVIDGGIEFVDPGEFTAGVDEQLAKNRHKIMDVADIKSQQAFGPVLAGYSLKPDMTCPMLFSTNL